jgi:hypothetical protein
MNSSKNKNKVKKLIDIIINISLKKETKLLKALEN